MAANETSVLLRRPLPPLKKKKREYWPDFSKKERKDSIHKNNVEGFEVCNCLERENTRQKTNDEVQHQQGKMIQYHKRLQMLLMYGKSYGKDPFPIRLPKKSTEINFNAFINDSYKPPPPAFTLDDFLIDSNENKAKYLGRSETDIVPLTKDKLFQSPTQELHLYKERKKIDNESHDDTKCHKILFDQNVFLPEITDRKPLRQQILEDKAFLFERYKLEGNKNIEAAIRENWPSIIRPAYINKDGKTISLEDTAYENDISEIIEKESCILHNDEDISSGQEDRAPTFRRAVNVSKTTRSIDIDYADEDIVLINSPPLYFQGERTARSPSPFEFSDLQSVFPAELAVFECAAHGATKLSLKAHFLDKLPDINQLASTLTYVNLSFNEFMRFPTELFLIAQLETLKMRNNPINEIPKEIKKLKKLRNLVLSFCCISTLPPSLFKLPKLENLDLSYNLLSFIPNEINNLRNLKVLKLEGNQLKSFPRAFLQLSLRAFNVDNNFTGPLFWKSTAPPQPQQLLDCCANFLAQTGQHFDMDNHDLKLNSFFKRISICDFCGGPMFGQGVRVIKPAAELFGVKNVPILFKVCSQTCRQMLRTSTDLSISPEFDDSL